MATVPEPGRRQRPSNRKQIRVALQRRAFAPSVTKAKDVKFIAWSGSFPSQGTRSVGMRSSPGERMQRPVARLRKRKARVESCPEVG